MTGRDANLQPAITGFGCLSPLGRGVSAQVEAMRGDGVGTGPYRQMELAEQVQAEQIEGGECVGLEAVAMHERAARGLALAVREALDDAGFDVSAPPYPPQRISAVLGTSLHGMNAAGAWLRGASAEVFDWFQSGHVLKQALAGLPVGGLRTTCSSACASSLSSLGHARALLESDLADLVICGGYDPISEYAVAGFHALRVVTLDRLRPFAADRQGMQVSEGYAVFVLERADGAAARGQRVRSLVSGLGESSDAHHLTQPHPDGAGAAAALNDAMRDAGLAPDAIDMVIAHATGTRDNDAAEAKALNAVFPEAPPWVAALKSRLGHSLGASGALEGGLAWACLDAGLMPTTAGVTAEQVGEPVRLVTGTPQPSEQTPAHVMSESLGFGGANAALIQSRPNPEAPSLASVSRASMNHGVSIVGIGVALPGVVGAGVPSVERLWETGKVEPSELKTAMPRSKSRRLSPLVRLSLKAAELAMQDARLDTETLPGLDAPAHERPACLVASANGSASYALDYYKPLVEEGYRTANPLLFAEGVPNAASAHLSMFLKLHGPSQSIIGTHTSGLDALALATLRIATGRWTTALVCIAEEDHLLVREMAAGCGHIAKDAPEHEGAIALVLRRTDEAGEAYAELSLPGFRSRDVSGDGSPPHVLDVAADATVCATDLRQDRALRDAGRTPLRHGPWFALGPGLALLDTLGEPTDRQWFTLASGCPTGLTSSIMVVRSHHAPVSRDVSDPPTA
ncbi:MAG: beta-ketoacyl synthase N-terminal-like domain-containing protein [Planctomycetota bacterium]